MNPLSLKAERFVVAARESDGVVQGFGQLAPLGGPAGGARRLELRSLIVDPEHRWACGAHEQGQFANDDKVPGLSEKALLTPAPVMGSVAILAWESIASCSWFPAQCGPAGAAPGRGRHRRRMQHAVEYCRNGSR